jgi:hypothetical protein
VLENRTHPNMQMFNASGFVLSAIKVNPTVYEENPNQVEAANRKNQKNNNNNNNNNNNKRQRNNNKKQKV